MMGTDRKISIRDELLNEILEELHSLEGQSLDEFIVEIGLDPANLLGMYESGLRTVSVASKRQRFEAAKKIVAESKQREPAKLIAFELAKKQMFAAVKARVAEMGEMTVAARNQRIDAEEDLDSFLEACLRLGLIDENGNIKE